MADLQLFPFQLRAATSIAERFARLRADPKRPAMTRSWDAPFYQALSALTGSGKTPILADSVAQIRAQLPTEPVVLWISKSKAVVDQTFSNFSAGGKYAQLLEDFVVTYLSDLTDDHISDASVPCLALATVGTFNQRLRSDGTLRVHRAEEDTRADSLWSTLRARQTRDAISIRRPLILVYDEAHNLSDQQTELLVDELEPDAILVASATMRTPQRLARVISRLEEHGWTEDDLVCVVPSKEVVEAGLVKRQIVLGGYATTMEAALDDLVSTLDGLTRKAAGPHTGFVPKAIYVCRTNVSQDDGSTDSPSRPFAERRAAPILIWRYLVEHKKVPPEHIAVYCDLKFDMKSNPPPTGFVLFNGGESDFAKFTAGEYRHIIFNQSLQEGWDDPACSLAYIDKSMGSAIQVEQVIGRVLRQPGARHFPDPDLNTAMFYIRIDDRQVFPEILETVQRKIAAEAPEISLTAYADRRDRNRRRLEPRRTYPVPEIHVDSSDAVSLLRERVAAIHDYRRDAGANITGKGELIRATQMIGTGERARTETHETPHSNRVMARWIVRREIQALYPHVAGAIDWSDPRFDARVEMTSAAAQALRRDAADLVELYLEHSELMFEEENPFHPGAVYISSTRKAYPFTHALHEKYSDLNELELEVARAIDTVGVPWTRNPVNGGYSIPLLRTGDSKRFYPDFLVWKDEVVFALDPKGEHLLAGQAGAKILSIRDENNNRRLLVRFLSKGKWSDSSTRAHAKGMTVWSLSGGGSIKGRHFPTVEAAVAAAVKKKV